MGTWQFSVRVALRWALRDRWRSLVLVTALALPLAGTVAAATLRSKAAFPAEEQIVAKRGLSETVLRDPGLVVEHGVPQSLTVAPAELAKLLGRNVVAHPEVTGSTSATSGPRSADSMMYGLELDQPIHHGRFELLDGRPARSSREAAVSAEVAERLRLRPGDPIGLGPDDLTVQVTGVLVDVADTKRPFVVATPALAARLLPDPPSTTSRTSLVAGTNPTAVAWHLTDHLDSTQSLDGAGWQIETREQAVAMVARTTNAIELPATPWILGACTFVLAQIGLVLGGRYAVVARRGRQRSSVRQRVIICHGALAGTAAVLAGFGLGLLTAWLLVPGMAEHHHQLWRGLRPDPATLALVAALGLTTPTVAARIAVQSSRTTDRRRPVNAVMPLTAGLLMVVAGAATFAPYLVTLGALVLVLGLVPAVRVVLKALAGRSRLRATGCLGPTTLPTTVLAAVTVVGGLVLTGLAALATNTERAYVPTAPHGSTLIRLTELPRPSTVDAVTEALGAQRIVEMRIASPPAPRSAQGVPYNAWGPFQVARPQQAGPPTSSAPVAVIDPADLDQILGQASPPRIRDALSAGQAVVMDARLVHDGVVTLQAPDPDTTNLPGQNGRTLNADLPAVVAQPRSAYSLLPAVYITDAGLTALRGTVQPHEAYLYAANDSGTTSAQQARAQAILTADIGSEAFTLGVEAGPSGKKILRNTTIAVILLTMIVTATLTSTLAGRDTRSGRSTITAKRASAIALLGVSIGLAAATATTPALLASLQGTWTATQLPGLLTTALAAVAAAGMTAKLHRSAPSTANEP